MKSKRELGLVVSLMVFLFVSAAPAADQPKMQAAKADLEGAKRSLEASTADKGGHRTKALELVAKAIISVNDGIEYDRTHRSQVIVAGGGANLATAGGAIDQRNMLAARNYLQSALTNLQHATMDKGGFRTFAIDQVKQAIAEVEAGMEYDRTH